jgi:outer membrane protein
MNNISIWLTGAALAITLNLHAQERKLSLADAVTLAMENNKVLKAEALDIASAKEEIAISKAAMLTSLSASAAYAYYFDRQNIFMPGTFAGNASEPVVDVAVGGKNAFNTYITLQQPILAEAARRQIKVSRIHQSQQEVDVKEWQARLAVEVTISYYRALLMEETIELNKQSLIRNMRSMNDSRMLLRQGKILQVDTLRNFIEVENLKTAISYLENQHKVHLLQLQQLLGQSASETWVLTDSLALDTENMYGWRGAPAAHGYIQSRPDIRARQLDVQLHENLLSQSRAQHLPTLSLIGQYQLQAQADDRRFESYRWPRTSFVGLQAQIPIFAGRKVASGVRKSKIDLQRSVLELADATEKANTEIATLQNNLREIIERLSTQSKTVEAADRTFRIVSDRYKTGLSSRLELSDAELALTEARLNQLNLIFQAKVVQLQLDKALGQL